MCLNPSSLLILLKFGVFLVLFCTCKTAVSTFVSPERLAETSCLYSHLRDCHLRVDSHLRVLCATFTGSKVFERNDWQKKLQPVNLHWVLFQYNNHQQPLTL